MRWLLALLLGVGVAAAQTNPPTVPFSPAWLYKADVRNGTLTGATLTTPTLTTPTMTGAISTGGTFTTPTLVTPTSTNGTFTTPTLTTPTMTGAVSTGGTFTTPTINQPTINGTTTNNSAAAGVVGEYISSTVLSGAAVSLTSATVANVTSISLTAGDWNVWGDVGFLPAGTTTMSVLIGAISTSTGALPTAPGGGAYAQLGLSFSTGTGQIMPAGMTRVSIASTTTVYLVADAAFGTSTLGAYGFIGARRVR